MLGEGGNDFPSFSGLLDGAAAGFIAPLIRRVCPGSLAWRNFAWNLGNPAADAGFSLVCYDLFCCCLGVFRFLFLFFWDLESFNL